ncbi:MAG: hypothetical protein ACLQPD_09815 [Desulfomonilaceae bacterium]
MSIMRFLLVLCCGLLLSLLLPPLYAQQDKAQKVLVVDKAAAPLVGVWEITQTKEPGKPYRSSYKGHPFVSRGPNAFTLIIEYHNDGTFRRIARVGAKDDVQEGKWKLAGNELRHHRADSNEEEVIYLRFDGPNQYTSTEVYEGTPDPGLFAQFKRIE